MQTRPELARPAILTAKNAAFSQLTALSATLQPSSTTLYASTSVLQEGTPTLKPFAKRATPPVLNALELP